MPEVVPQLVRQLVYTMFVSNNRASLHLWRMKILLKHQRVSKYYGRGCPQQFLLHFIYLVKTKVAKRSHV